MREVSMEEHGCYEPPYLVVIEHLPWILPTELHQSFGCYLQELGVFGIWDPVEGQARRKHQDIKDCDQEGEGD